jgi:hypothetical protein
LIRLRRLVSTLELLVCPGSKNKDLEAKWSQRRRIVLFFDIYYNRRDLQTIFKDEGTETIDRLASLGRHDGLGIAVKGLYALIGLLPAFIEIR